MIKSYSELQRIYTFEERFEYLRLNGSVGKSTFGFDRYLNQMLYRSVEWLRLRDVIIVRDRACDLGIIGREIYDRIVIHHMNPISIEDIQSKSDKVFDPEFLICTTETTHRAIHYGDKSLLIKLPLSRRPNDTTPWR